jgi:ABC-type transport system involved in cytochrome bd biosynthesis fused ATPase/permease subunit
VPMVAIIDVLALTGLVLYIAGIPSPFVPLRHVLPFVSVVPLGVELYGALSHNDGVTAVIVTVIVVAIMVTVAWQCFRTIERLFVSPVTAAREKAREQLTALTVGMAQLMEQNSVVAEFVTAWQGQAVTATITDTPVALSEGESKTARVKALADQYGVSMSTAWRKVKAGEWNVEEIN